MWAMVTMDLGLLEQKVEMNVLNESLLPFAKGVMARDSACLEIDHDQNPVIFVQINRDEKFVQLEEVSIRSNVCSPSLNTIVVHFASNIRIDVILLQ